MLFNASSMGTCPFLIPLCLNHTHCGLRPLRQRHELIKTQRKRFSSSSLSYENYLTLNKRDTTISYIQSGHKMAFIAGSALFVPTQSFSQPDSYAFERATWSELLVGLHGVPVLGWHCDANSLAYPRCHSIFLNGSIVVP